MVSYLSYSQYGTSGQEIAINNATLNSGGSERTIATGKNGVDSAYAITGMTQGLGKQSEILVTLDEIKSLSGNTPTSNGNIYAWNQFGGVVASSTRNITGVYDLSGATYEKTASYVANQNVNLSKYGNSLTYNQNTLKETSTKYTIVYPYDKSQDNNSSTHDIASAANYAMNTKIYGDGIREVSTTGINFSAWQNNDSYFAGLGGPFLGREGNLGSIHAGRFAFYRATGESHYGDGFRTIVIPMT